MLLDGLRMARTENLGYLIDVIIDCVNIDAGLGAISYSCHISCIIILNIDECIYRDNSTHNWMQNTEHICMVCEITS